MCDRGYGKIKNMKLKIAFLQLMPGAAIEDNIELQMAIAITLLEKHEPNPRNTVCLFDRHGKLVYRYSKVHICNFGEEDDESVLDAGGWFDDLLRQGISRSSQGFDDERGGTSSCSKCLPDGNQPPVSAARTGL